MAMDLGGLSSIYTDYMNETAANQTASKLQQDIRSNSSEASDEKLMSACKQFEAYFLEQVFKEMQKTVPETEYSDTGTSSMVSYVKESFAKQISEDASNRQGMGLAQTLFDQMKRNYGL